jgi:hypothetical protein
MPEWNNLGSTVFHLLSALICPPARARCPSPAPAPPCAGLFLPILSLVRSCKGGDPAPPGRSHHVNIAPSNASDQRGETENRLHDAEIAPGHGFDVGLLGGARFELSPKALDRPSRARPRAPVGREARSVNAGSPSANASAARPQRSSGRSMSRRQAAPRHWRAL